MDELTALKNIVRTGWVSSVNAADRTARVTFQDKGETFVSGPLKVLKNSPFIPAAGDFVLCIYLPNGDGDGFVIGGI